MNLKRITKARLAPGWLGAALTLGSVAWDPASLLESYRALLDRVGIVGPALVVLSAYVGAGLLRAALMPASRPKALRALLLHMDVVARLMIALGVTGTYVEMRSLLADGLANGAQVGRALNSTLWGLTASILVTLVRELLFQSKRLAVETDHEKSAGGDE